MTAFLRFLARRALPLALLLTHVSPMPAAELNPGRQHPQRIEITIRRQVSVPYLLFLPSDYQADGARRWPLMIFLHGAGERGHDLQLVTRHGPPKIVGQRPDFPFIVASPQCPPGERWDTVALDAMLSDLLQSHAVDPKRVYLTGLSMGGFGTWAWASASPDRFAAIVPICGGGDPIPVWLSAGPARDALARLPIWAFHGAKDTVVTLAESERMIEAYRRIGNQPKLTVYPEAGHDSWTETYDNPALYEWLLSHQRP